MKLQDSDLPLQLAYRWEKERPGTVFMTQPIGGGAVRDYTWAATMAEVRSMAAHLQSLGFPPGTKIAMLTKNCAHFILSDLAIWMAGYVSVALYPTQSPEQIEYILQHSESKLLFVGKLDTWAQQKAAVPADLPCIAFPLAPANDYPKWDDIIKKTPPLTGNPVRTQEDTSCLIYTSGSTGNPKGVEHTFYSISGSVISTQKIINVTSEDRMMSYLPLAHAFERCAVEMLAIRASVHLFFVDSLDTFVEDVCRARPTIFHSVPRLWLKFQLGVLKKMPQKKLDFVSKIPILSGIVKKKILKGLGLDQTRIAITGSAPVPPELIQWYRNLGLELLEGYAMTEDFIYSHLSLPGKSRVGYVGNVLPGAEAKISAEGEILLKSPGNMKGYYKDPELTQASYTEDGFFKTGDRGEYDKDGRLRITGRVKELFKSQKGKYIAPAPIENLLNAHNDVEMSCVTGAGQPEPLALLQLSEHLRHMIQKGSFDKATVEQSLTKLLADINGQVEEWEKLGCLVVVKDEWQIENGFLTPTMKLKRSKVDESYTPLFDSWLAQRKKVIWQ